MVEQGGAGRDGARGVDGSPGGGPAGASADAAVDAGEVLIAGAGPVGLTLALDLAQRGVRVAVIERNTTPRRLPKMERCNARTMEIFRRLGLAGRVRAASRFIDIPMDVFVCTRLTEPPLLHLRYPSVTAAQRRIRECADGSQPLEPAQLISQYTLEPLLEKALAEAGVDVLHGFELRTLAEDEHGVVADVVAADGAPGKLRARYLVGCDGGASTVRKQLGIPLEGQGRIRKVHQVFFRSEQLFARIPIGKGRHYYFPEGAIVVQDDLRHFMINLNELGEGEDPTPRVAALIGFPVDIEILNVASWNYHLLAAERYRSAGGRAFIAGDAAHLVIPQGGLGMNTGVGDAIDLGWKLAGTLAGWGGPGLLDSYETERRQVALRNRMASALAVEGVRKWREACGSALRDATPEGQALREQVARLAAVGQPTGHEFLGVELGYRYDGSPIVCADTLSSGLPPPHTFTYDPSTWPGTRLPHMWCADGSAVQDRLGAGYTLLRVGPQPPATAAFEAALRATGLPLDVLELPEAALLEVYRAPLLLVRPDLHVVWRGNVPPGDAAGAARVAAVVSGKAVQ